MPWLKTINQNLRVVRKGFPAELLPLADNIFKKHVKQHNSYPIGADKFILDTGEKVFVPARIHTDPY